MKTYGRVGVLLYSFFFLWRYSPNSGLCLSSWNSPFHFGLLDLRHSVGLLGRVISSSQGIYLYTNTEKCTYTLKHQTSMPWGEFEPTIPAPERSKIVHARLSWQALLYLMLHNCYRNKVWWNAYNSVWDTCVWILRTSQFPGGGVLELCHPVNGGHK
jgi:hypothetical protein